jgi:serine/threonine protein kinase/predicted Zn-dependent peptidase
MDRVMLGDDASNEPTRRDVTPVASSGAIGLASRIALQRARERILSNDAPPTRIGRYVIERRIGAGGMGIVYCAHDPDLGRDVAIKVLRSEVDGDRQREAWLLREAKALAKLNHPNVVHVYEVGRHEGHVYLAMELVAGRTLRAWVREEKPTWREVVAKYLDAARGLVAAHEAGVIHRDFKPDNVIIGLDGRVRVLDFGLARPELERDEVRTQDSVEGGGEVPEETITGTIAGTPAYMDPQRLMGERADASSDQFGLCVSLFEALQGRRPYEGETLEALLERMRAGPRAVGASTARDVPVRVHEAILRGLATDRGDRFPDVRTLVETIEQHARPARRRWVLPLAIAASLAVTFGWLASRASPAAEDPPSIESSHVENPWTAIALASDLPEPVAEPLPDDPAGVTVHRLSNGLTVYLAFRPEQPRLTTGIAIRAGRNDETPETRGVTWLTAHARASGSARLGTRDFAAEEPLLRRHHELLRRLPAASSASERETLVREADEAYVDSLPNLALRDPWDVARTFGSTVSYIGVDLGTFMGSDVSVTRLEAWARLEAELLRRPVFRGFTREAFGVLQRLSWKHGGPQQVRNAVQLLLEEAGVPAEHPDEEAAFFASFPLGEVEAFHGTYYAPNTTAIVLVGEVGVDEALRAVEAAFGDWEPVPRPSASEPRDEPWPGERRFRRVEAPGSPSVMIGWPLPPPGGGGHERFEALAHVLEGDNGLLASMLESDEDLGAWSSIDARALFVGASVPEGKTHEEVEADLLGVLQALADDRVEDAAWTRAIANHDLLVASWASSPRQLATLLMRSYLARRDWTEHAPTLAPGRVGRAEIVAAARQALGRGVAVVHSTPGESWHSRAEMPAFPAIDPPDVEEPSEHARALMTMTSRTLEPLFLVEGRHFDRRPHGSGVLVTRAAPSPLFHLAWVHPIGTRDEPFACDALRFRTAIWLEDLPSLAAARLQVRCGAQATTLELEGIDDRFDEIMADLRALVPRSGLDAERVSELRRDTIAARRRLRDDPVVLADALHAWAVRREASVDRWMPSDAELGRASVDRLEQALGSLTASDPAILYAGPRPHEVARMLSPPRGGAGPSSFASAPVDPPAESTVYVLDRPGVEVAAAQLHLFRAGSSASDEAVAQLFDGIPAPGGGHARRGRMNFWALPPRDTSMSTLVTHGWGYRGNHDVIADVLATAATELRSGAPIERMVEYQGDVEAMVRLARLPDARVPHHVLTWGPDRAIDPRMERWVALGRTGEAAMAAYVERVSKQPIVVSIVGDLAQLDRRRLATIGKVVVVDAETVIRDVGSSDSPPARIQ